MDVMSVEEVFVNNVEENFKNVLIAKNNYVNLIWINANFVEKLLVLDVLEFAMEICVEPLFVLNVLVK